MMKKVTVWLDETYAGALTVTAVGHTAAETNVAAAATALKDADVIIIRPGGDIRYEKEGDYPSGPAGHLPSQGEARETDAVTVVRCRECAYGEELMEDYLCWEFDATVKADDYCSRGVRKHGKFHEKGAEGARGTGKGKIQSAEGAQPPRGFGGGRPD